GADGWVSRVRRNPRYCGLHQCRLRHSRETPEQEHFQGSEGGGHKLRMHSKQDAAIRLWSQLAFREHQGHAVSNISRKVRVVVFKPQPNALVKGDDFPRRSQPKQLIEVARGEVATLRFRRLHEVRKTRIGGNSTVPEAQVDEERSGNALKLLTIGLRPPVQEEVEKRVTIQTMPTSVLCRGDECASRQARTTDAG